MVAQDLSLQYYVDAGQKEKKGEIDISSCTEVRSSKADTKSDFELELVCKQPAERVRILSLDHAIS